MIIGYKPSKTFRFFPLWTGARGVEFDWKYIQMSVDSNISLVNLQGYYVNTALSIDSVNGFLLRLNICRLLYWCICTIETTRLNSQSRSCF